jgi:hypothetical protein
MEKLKDRRLFFSSSGDGHDHSSSRNNNKDQWTAEQLRIVPKQYRDERNAPLLPDLERGSTAYISEKYTDRLDLPVLRKLGTVELSTSPDFLDRLTQDLSRGRKSQWQSINYTDNWFTRISNLLLASTGARSIKETMQRLELVPLGNGNWVASRNASIFFPTSGGVDIPKKLKLSLLDGDALNNSAFKDLLTSLGVVECEPGQVIPLIEQRYRLGGSLNNDLLVQDIVFLFWHHKEVPETGYDIFLSCKSGDTQYSWGNVAYGGWHYYPKPDHPYALYKLLDGEVPSELRDQIKFPRRDYFDALEKCAPRHGKTGPEWLRQRAEIKLEPQLRSKKQTTSMSPELKYIAEKMPHYLLGVLEHDWFQYKRSEEWDKYIKETEVPILESPNERSLETTFLPLPSLQRIVKELRLSNQFGFLEELDGMTEVESVKWDFLKQFGVGVKDDLHFWLTLLRRAKNAENVQKSAVFKIYTRLQAFIDKDDVKIIR